MSLPPDLKERLTRVRLLAMDVDGVLTDGGVYIDEAGREFRRFNIKDGHGLVRVMEAGIQVLWLSAGTCESAQHRARKLGIPNVHLGVRDKAGLLERRCREWDILLAQVVYIGDDLTDLLVMGVVGVACAPADAAEEVKGAAHLVTAAPGGHGAVREICDLLLEREIQRKN